MPPWDWLWEHRWSGALGACVLGLGVSAGAVLAAPASGKALLADLYLGRRPNPRLFGERVDAKMFLYAFGATLLELNLGEILMATGLALSLGYPELVAPWLYVLYYVLLLGFRERDDNRRCAEKYGVLWDEYRAAVLWRIVPRVY